MEGENLNIDPKYVNNVYNALKKTVPDFDKSPEEFKESLKSKQYVSNVHGALKKVVPDFDKDLKTFESLVYENPIQKKNQVGSGSSTSKKTPSVSTSKVAPTTSLDGGKTQPVVGSEFSVGGNKTGFKGIGLPAEKEANKENRRLNLKWEVGTAKVTPKNMDEISAKSKELDILNAEKTNKVIKQGEAKVSKDKNVGFGGYLAESIQGSSAGIMSSVARLPELIFDINQAGSRKLSDAFGIGRGTSDYNAKQVMEKLGITNDVADELDKVVKSSNEKIEIYKAKNGGDALTAFENGEILKSAKLLAGDTLQSAPLMFAAIATGGGAAALATMGAVSASMSYAELQKENPEMDQDVKLASAVGSGLLEAYLGHFFSGASGAVAKRILIKEGAEQGAKVIAKGFKGMAMDVIEKNPVIAAVGEYVEEYSVDVGQQLIEIANGTRKEIDYNRAKKAGFSSLGMGGINTVAIYGSKGYVKASDYKKAKEVNRQIASLSDELSNPNLSDSDKRILASRVDKLILENKKIIGDGLNKIKALPNDVKSEIVDINGKLEGFRDKVIELEDNLVITPETKDALITEIKSNVKELTDRKLKIIEGTYVQDDFNKLSDAEKMQRKDKASRELLNEAQAKGEEKASFDDAQITKKAIEDYGTERKQKSDRESANQEEPTGDKTTAEPTQPTAEAEGGVRSVQEEVDKTYYYNTDPKRGPVESAPETLPEGYSSATPVSNSFELDAFNNQNKINEIKNKLSTDKSLLLNERIGLENELKDLESKSTPQETLPPAPEVKAEEVKGTPDAVSEPIDLAIKQEDVVSEPIELSKDRRIKSPDKKTFEIDGKKYTYLKTLKDSKGNKIVHLRDSNGKVKKVTGQDANEINRIQLDRRAKAESKVETEDVFSEDDFDAILRDIEFNESEYGLKSNVGKKMYLGDKPGKIKIESGVKYIFEEDNGIIHELGSIEDNENLTIKDYGIFKDYDSKNKDAKSAAEKARESKAEKRKKADEDFYKKKEKAEFDAMLEEEKSANAIERMANSEKRKNDKAKITLKDGDVVNVSYSIDENGKEVIKVTTQTEGGAYVPVKNDSKIKEATNRFKSERDSKNKKIDDAKNELLSDNKKETKDRIIKALDAIINATDTKGKMYSNALPLIAVNNAAKIVKAAYIASKDMASAIKAGYDYIKSKGYDVSEAEFKKALLGLKNNQDTPKETIVEPKNKPNTLKEKLKNQADKYKEKLNQAKAKTNEVKEELKDAKAQLKSVFSASLEAVKQVKNRAEKNSKIRFEIGGAIESFKGKGKITQTQAAIISKKLAGLDVEDLDAVEDFMNQVDDVFKRSDYYEKVNVAKKDAKSLKTASNNKEKDNTLRTVAKELASLDPSILDADKTLGVYSEGNISIDEHIEMLNKASDGLKQTTKTTKEGGSTLIQRRALNVNEVLDYIEKFKAFELKKAKEKYKEVFNREPDNDLTSSEINTKISEYNSLKTTYKRLIKASKGEMTPKEIKSLNEEANAMSPEDLSDFLFNEKDVDSEDDFSKRYKDEVEDVILANATINAGKTLVRNTHPLTGEPFTDEVIDIVNSSINSSKLDMTTKQMLDLANKLENFAENGLVGGLGAFMAKAKSAKNKSVLVEKDLKGFPFKRYFRKDIGAAIGKYLSSPRMLADEIFRGKTNGDLIWKSSGLQEFQNGTAKGIKLAKNVLDKFDEVKNKSGEKFMDAENVYERGMLAHVMRDVGATKEARDKNFLKVKSWMEQSIDNLLNSEDKVEVEKGEVYRKVFDKILKDSNTIEEVVSKSDKFNIDAIGIYQEANNLEHEKTKFTKDAYYNEGMRKDEGYAFPVKYGVIDTPKSIDVTDSSVGKGKTPNLRQKATSMNDDTRANKLNDNYIDLDFDRIAHQEFEKVAIANRALPFAFQYKAFRDMNGFKDLIKDKGTRDMFTSVLEDYIIESQGVSTSKYDREVSGVTKLLAPFRKAGTTMALVSLTAPIKQAIPMIPSTLLNAGRFDFSLATNKDYKAFLDRSGTSTANRGLGSLTMFDSAASSLKANKKSWFGKLRQRVGNAQDKSLKLAVGIADSEIAKVSWGSYYQQKAGKVKDWKTHKLNKKAADYADSMVDSDQGSSDPNLVGKAFKSKGLEGEILKTMLMFARFKVNMASNIAKNVVIASSKHTNNQDRKVALRGLAGSASQAATFGALSMGIKMGTEFIANAISGDDEEEKEALGVIGRIRKEKKEILENKELQEVYLNLSNRFAVDMLSPIPVTDSLITSLMAKLVEEYNADVPEEYRPEIKTYSNDKWYSGFGPIGVLVDKLHKTYEAVSVSISGDTGDKKDDMQTINAQESLLTNTVFPTLLVLSALTGLGLSDVNNLFIKSIKQTPKTSEGMEKAKAFGTKYSETRKEQKIEEKQEKKEGRLNKKLFLQRFRENN